jgi:hypothetical protein
MLVPSPLSLLISYTPTKSNLYCHISLELLWANLPSTDSLHFTKSHIKCPRLCVTLRNKVIFYDMMIAPSPTPNLKNNPLSAARDCLLNMFVATLHIWRPSPPSATRGRAMPWWQVTQYFRRCWKDGFSCELCRGKKEAVPSTNYLLAWSKRKKLQ